MDKQEIRKLSFYNGTITIRQIDGCNLFLSQEVLPKAKTYKKHMYDRLGVTGRWEIIEIEKLNMEEIASVISKLLKGTSVECESIQLGGINFYKWFSEEEIFKIISKNKDFIEKNIDFILVK